MTMIGKAMVLAAVASMIATTTEVKAAECRRECRTEVVCEGVVFVPCGQNEDGTFILCERDGPCRPQTVCEDICGSGGGFDDVFNPDILRDFDLDDFDPRFSRT